MGRWLLPGLLALGACALGGCGRVGFELVARADGGSDDGASDDVDLPARDCWSRWFDGTLAFDAPVRLAELGGTAYQLDPSLADDDLTLYFSQKVGTTEDYDIHVTTRANRGDPWQPPRIVPELTSSSSDARVSSTDDGLLVVFASARPATDIELWLATRSTRAEPFGALDRSALTSLSTTEDEHDPELTGDGLRVYLAPGGVMLRQRVVVASRATRSEPFGPPVTIPIAVTGNEYAADPSVSPDERVLLFARYGPSGTALHYMTRADRDATFTASRALPVAGPASSNSGAELARDGCEVIFEREGSGTKQLHVTHMAR